MSSRDVNEIEPQDLPHEAKTALQDIAYLTRRYRAIYRRMYPQEDGQNAIWNIFTLIAHLSVNALIEERRRHE